MAIEIKIGDKVVDLSRFEIMHKVIAHEVNYIGISYYGELLIGLDGFSSLFKARNFIRIEDYSDDIAEIIINETNKTKGIANKLANAICEELE